MTKLLWISGFTLVVLLLAAAPAGAQPVISARSGVIAYGEGSVYLGDKPWEPSNSQFEPIKENSVVHTGEGRVEVLLVPGSFLRLGENSSFRLLTNRLIDTRLELLSGSAILEVDQVTKDDNVTVVCKQGTVQFLKAGLYRLDAEPGRIKVFKGTAAVKIGERTVDVPSGRMLELAGETASLEKFESDDTDSLDNWSHRRGDMVASANISAAQYVSNNSGFGLYSNSWVYNPFLGMYTFLPYSGQMFSPYGNWFWSPVTVTSGAYYNPPQVVMRRGSPLAGGASNPTPTMSRAGELVSARSMSAAPPSYSGSMGMSSSAPVSSSSSSGGSSSGGSHGMAGISGRK